MSSAKHISNPLATFILAILLAACAGAEPSSTVEEGGVATPVIAVPSAAATPQASPALPTAAPRPSVDAGAPWIVYQDQRGIRLVRPDGSDDHQLVDDPPETQFHPDWSHDGQRIAYAVDDADGTRDIWVSGADGEDPQLVFDCAAPCRWTDSPAWSPTDAELAFERAFAIAGTPDGPGRSSVQVLDLASGADRAVFVGAATEYVYSPRWAPDGASIVLELTRFDSDRLDAEIIEAQTIGIVDLGDHVPSFQALLPWDSGASYPDWSPDGDHIAFVLRRSFDEWDGPADIHVIAADGTGLTRVTSFGDAGGRAIQPSFVPDGGALIFVAEDVIFEPRVGFVGVDGSGQRQLDDGAVRTHPRLRPVR